MKPPSSKTATRSANRLLLQAHKLKHDLVWMDDLPRTRESRKLCVHINKMVRRFSRQHKEMVREIRRMLLAALPDEHNDKDEK